MNKLLAFGASSSKNSRNKRLASYVANRMAPKEAILVDLNEFEMPIYSEDREQEIGIPDKAYEFKKLVNESIGIFSIPEAATYFSASSLICLHIYNLKYCRCDNEDCCTS